MAYVFHMIVNSPLGDILVQGTQSHIQFLKFVDALAEDELVRHEAAELAEVDRREADWAESCRLQLQQYFAGSKMGKGFDLPIDPQGTEFQKQVWQALCEVEQGDYASYQGLALAIGNKNAVRAVASANARNPIWLLIPCHRIIGTDLALRGYAGGIERKAQLLMLEGLSLNCDSSDQVTEKTKLMIQSDI